MINEEILKNIESGINSRPSPLCGGRHHVSFRQNAIHSSAHSSAVNVLFPTGDSVSVEVSEDACEGFAQRVQSFLLSKASAFIELPFDKI